MRGVFRVLSTSQIPPHPDPLPASGERGRTEFAARPNNNRRRHNSIMMVMVMAVVMIMAAPVIMRMMLVMMNALGWAAATRILAEQ
jgi:hypothetical protein